MGKNNTIKMQFDAPIQYLNPGLLIDPFNILIPELHILKWRIKYCRVIMSLRSKSSRIKVPKGDY
jgi:hypothetical protein